MRYHFHTADVFTDRIFGGNQLAVFPDAAGLTTEQMQQVACEFGYSETVFVFPPASPENTRRLRIFTPGGELPFAGHPTIGTAHVLTESGDISLDGAITQIVLEEGVGSVAVAIYARDGRPIFAQLSVPKLPETGPEPPTLADIAQVLSLDVADLLAGDDRPQAVSCGVPFLLVPLRNPLALGRIRVDQGKWASTLSGFWAPHLFAFSYQPERSGSEVQARMFAPALNVTEDPATGAAAACLAGFLAARSGNRNGTLHWVIEQGVTMGRPSRLAIEADMEEGKITAVRVGGSTVLVSEGTMEIPEFSD